jgi:exodeoxyribonuclease VII large subunit
MNPLVQLNITQALTVDKLYTVSQINRVVRQTLEDNFACLWIIGEVSNFLAHSSGHWYFSLKDSQAQVRCVFFRGHNRKLAIQPTNGMQIKIKAKVSLYEGRGDFQLMVEELAAAGEGALQQAFAALKKKLAAAGWFDLASKQTLPALPCSIGVVTSASGAAIRDVLSILQRRFPCAPVIVYPTLVQGDSAPQAISQAINLANQRQEVDVLIITRGGGSLEDLWAFNAELVAAAIYHSKIPTIAAIGHEIDFTIADFVADVRAPTPSSAAELATPDRQELLHNLKQQQRQLTQQMLSKIRPMQQQLAWLTKNLHQQHPQSKLNNQLQQVDLYTTRLINLYQQLQQRQQAKLATVYNKIINLKPYPLLLDKWQELNAVEEKLHQVMINIIHKYRLSLANMIAKIDGLSPLNTLQRGYAVVSCQAQAKIIKYAAQVTAGDLINLRLQDGMIACQVLTVKKLS